METLRLPKIRLLIYGAPLAVIFISVGLAVSPLLVAYPQLATGIIYDLTLTSPVIYLMLIWNRPIPKATVVPIFIVGVVLASFLLPDNQHFHLNLVKTFLLPVVELLVVTGIVLKVRKTVNAFKANASSEPDFYLTLKKSTMEALEIPLLARAMSTEIAVFYFSLFPWKKEVPRDNEFSSYKDNGAIALLGAIIFILVAETFVLHTLLAHWSTTFAWILSATSIYTGFQLFGHIKAMIFRPSTMTAEALHLKYGLFGDITIPWEDVDRVALHTGSMETALPGMEQLALLKGLETANVMLSFKKTQTIEKLYGFTKSCDNLLVHIDNSPAFIEKARAAILNLNTKM
ncbi:hypothetical protein RT717_15140 [Imperialibacter roseus]|uniref:Beta-carotene 15,15'-monooxygenase n=1 Tax=Imperialibacter roseus TaxID=1324217 RepID=A0ABZ0IH91_9BACT|nr:hypothetical protein [Imperialibacter roseus]WOK04414.1 hypothetical protein RT717_15140 [Imperialibacter roseus]